MCGRYRSELTAQVMSGMKKGDPIMRALQISAYDGDPLKVLELVDIPQPGAPAVGEVLIDVAVFPDSGPDRRRRVPPTAALIAACPVRDRGPDRYGRGPRPAAISATRAPRFRPCTRWRCLDRAPVRTLRRLES